MQPNTYWSDKLQRGECERTVLLYRKANTTVVQYEGNASLASCGAIADADIAAFLKLAASPFTLLAFDSTSMGNDVFGAIIDFQGQVRELVMVEAEYIGEAVGTTIAGVHLGIPKSASMTATSLVTQADAVGGNVAVKVDFGNTPDFDGTAGWVKLTVHWRSY